MRVSNKTSQLRKLYTAPHLIQYGSIRELTKGGTGKHWEDHPQHSGPEDKT